MSVIPPTSLWFTSTFVFDVDVQVLLPCFLCLYVFGRKKESVGEDRNMHERGFTHPSCASYVHDVYVQALRECMDLLLEIVLRNLKKTSG